MAEATPYDFLIKALQEIARDIVIFLPNIVLAIVVLAIAIAAIGVLNKIVRRVLKVVGLDELFKRIVKTELPFSPASLIIILIDLGIVLITVFGIATLLLGPEQVGLVRELVGYGARIVSIVAVVIIALILFNATIDRVRVETRMRGYFLFILLILITAMVIDLTALSTSTKMALEQGLSIGIGIAVGVFAIWFFFHDYLDRLVKAPTQEEDKAE